MSKIGNLTTVNCGQIFEFSDVTCEALSPAFSGHLTNMVCLYASEGIVKVAVAYDGEDFYVSRFRTPDATQHYWSRRYTKEQMNNKKYQEIARLAIACYHRVFKA